MLVLRNKAHSATQAQHTFFLAVSLSSPATKTLFCCSVDSSPVGFLPHIVTDSHPYTVCAR